MDIAVAFEKINIGDYYCIFKPQGIIRGVFDSKTRTFESECGIIYDMMQEGEIESDNYFDFPTTLFEIKAKFGDSVGDEALLSEYLTVCTDSCYIGYYDNDKYKIMVKQIPFELIEENSLPILNSQDDTLVEFSFSPEFIQNLRNSNSLDEVKEKLGEILSLAERIKKEKVQCKSNEEREESKKSRKLSLKKDESRYFDLIKLRRHVKKSIIGQDDAIDDITRTIAINITSENPRNKSHMLIMGPSGTGKTEIMKNIVQYLNVPVFQADATAYTKAGYVGKDVNSILLGLLRAANNDLELAQNGVIIIDEIDKKALNDIDDVSGKAVLHSLLKILDREVIEVDTDYHSSILFDTSNLTVVLVGSFQELYNRKVKFQNKPIGFNSTFNEEPKFTLTDEELIKYLGPELFGRIGMKTSTNHLSLKTCIDILAKSDIGQISIAKADFKNRGITFLCTKGYLTEIAKKGYSSETGARNLNKVAKENLKYAYDEIFTRKKVKQLKFTKETANNPKKFYVE